MFIKQFLKFIRYFGKGYEFRLLYILFMSFMSSFLEFISVVLTFPFIMILVNPGRVANNPVAAFFHNTFGVTGVRSMILCIGGLIASIIIFKNIYSILITYWQNKLISQWGFEVKEKLMEYFLYSPYEVDLKKGNTQIIYQITKNVDEVMQYYIFKVIAMISNTFVIILVFSILIFMLPLFTMLAIMFFSIAGSFQSGLFRNWSMKLAAKKYNLTSGPYMKVVNSLNCIKDIKINGCEKFFLDFFTSVSEKIIPYNEKINLIPLIPQYLLEIIFIFTMIILCFGILSKYGENPSNILISFGIVAIAIYRLVPQVYKNQVYLNYINLYTKPLEELFAIYDSYSVYKLPANKDSVERIPFNNSIRINNLNYSYDGVTQVLFDIDLNIKKGEFIGIVGLSGSGKSTLIDCILGLLNYTGDIYIDDTRLNNDNYRTFRNIVGYVPQKITTVEGDVYANVAWGVHRKDIDKEKVDSVLKTAQLYDQLTQTENGIEIELKQDGTGLSGGQLQRIGIARALYREPEVLILDEATANLDVKIEHKLTDIINNIKGKKTIIAIAHRLSTLLNCDRIAYIKEGILVDVGTFKELSEKYTDFKEIIKLSRIKIDEELDD